MPNQERTSRDLVPITRATVEQAKQLLPMMADRLTPGPSVAWTRRVGTTTWGHWNLKLSGKGQGKSVIRINRLFRANPAIVPDDMLEYLIYHELLHHLLPLSVRVS